MRAKTCEASATSDLLRKQSVVNKGLRSPLPVGWCPARSTAHPLKELLSGTGYWGSPTTPFSARGLCFVLSGWKRTELKQAKRLLALTPFGVPETLGCTQELFESCRPSTLLLCLLSGARWKHSGGTLWADTNEHSLYPMR